MASIGSLDDLLHVNLVDAGRQWEQVSQRQPYEQGRRQPDFTPVEIVLCHAASQLVEHGKYGSSSSHNAPEPVQLLARLFERPPSSILAKMANLDGSRSHGGRFDQAAGLVWTADPRRSNPVYAVALTAARRFGIGAGRLPDFLDPSWAG